MQGWQFSPAILNSVLFRNVDLQSKFQTSNLQRHVLLIGDGARFISCRYKMTLLLRKRLKTTAKTFLLATENLIPGRHLSKPGIENLNNLTTVLCNEICSRKQTLPRNSYGSRKVKNFWINFSVHSSNSS